MTPSSSHYDKVFSDVFASTFRSRVEPTYRTNRKGWTVRVWDPKSGDDYDDETIRSFWRGRRQAHEEDFLGELGSGLLKQGLEYGHYRRSETHFHHILMTKAGAKAFGLGDRATLYDSIGGESCKAPWLG